MGIGIEVEMNQMIIKMNNKLFSGSFSTEIIKSNVKTNPKGFEDDFLGIPEEPFNQSGDQDDNMFVHYYFYDCYFKAREAIQWRQMDILCPAAIQRMIIGQPLQQHSQCGLADLFHLIEPITLSGIEYVSNLQIFPSFFGLPHPNPTRNSHQGFHPPSGASDGNPSAFALFDIKISNKKEHFLLNLDFYIVQCNWQWPP